MQPSQLYISSAKLARVRAAWFPPRADRLPAISIRRLAGAFVATDGHTRALASYLAGLPAVPVVWDTDELDWEAYRICLGWCRTAGIRTVMDLHGRVVSPAAYQVLWLDRCRAMHRALAARRA